MGHDWVRLDLRKADVLNQLPPQLCHRLDVSVWFDRTVLLIERTPERRAHIIKLDKNWKIPDDQLVHLCVVVR